MNDYGRPGFIGLTAFLVVDRANIILIDGLIIVTVISLLLGLATIVRYFANDKIYLTN
jgi:hypothetical protein